jgi:hypothetical protein
MDARVKPGHDAQCVGLPSQNTVGGEKTTKRRALDDRAPFLLPAQILAKRAPQSAW